MDCGFIKIPGYIMATPCLCADLSIEGNVSQRFYLRIDTGADITSVPSHLYRFLSKVDNGLRVQGLGESQTVNVYNTNLRLFDNDNLIKSFDNIRVITMQADVGLLGLDLLQYFSLLMENGRFILE